MCRARAQTLPMTLAGGINLSRKVALGGAKLDQRQVRPTMSARSESARVRAPDGTVCCRPSGLCGRHSADTKTGANHEDWPEVVVAGGGELPRATRSSYPAKDCKVGWPQIVQRERQTRVSLGIDWRPMQGEESRRLIMAPSCQYLSPESHESRRVSHSTTSAPVMEVRPSSTFGFDNDDERDLSLAEAKMHAASKRN